MTTPEGAEPDGSGPDGPTRERPCRRAGPDPGVGRQGAVAASGTEPATVPGLVVTEERLPDGRRITYFSTSPAGTPR